MDPREEKDRDYLPSSEYGWVLEDLQEALKKQIERSINRWNTLAKYSENPQIKSIPDEKKAVDQFMESITTQLVRLRHSELFKEFKKRHPWLFPEKQTPDLAYIMIYSL